MTNERLVELIQEGGNDELLPVLWDKTRDFIQMLIVRNWTMGKDTFRQHGYELPDVRQEGYNALLLAVKQYSSEKPYKFTTFLTYAVKNTLRGLLRGKVDVLNRSGTVSIELPIGVKDDGSERLIADVMPDESTAQEYERIDGLDEFKPLHEAVDSLPERERNVIQMRYFEGLTLRKAAVRLGVSYQRVQQIEHIALRLLRSGKIGKKLRETYGDEYAPRYDREQPIYAKHKGLSAFRTSGSSEVEDFVLQRLVRSGN